MVDAVQEVSVIVGELYFLPNCREVRLLRALSELLGNEINEVRLVIFFANVFLDGFQEMTIHLRSRLQGFS